MSKKVNKKPFNSPSADELFKDKEIFDGITFDTTPSPEDDRDYDFQRVCIEAPVEESKLPEEFRLEQTEILDQGSIGSCVAHACATALSSGEQRIIGSHNSFSRGYIYGNRKSSDSQNEGMVIRQAIKQLHNCGDVLYEDFPYNKVYKQCVELIDQVGREELADKAKEYAIIDYFRCYDVAEIKNSIMTRGGVIICVPVYTDFGRDLHQTTTKRLRGYHAMIIIGWTKDDKWIVQNSWGEDWGYNGCLLMDMNYPVNEYWAITINTDHAVKPTPAPKKKSIFEKIWEFIKNLFRKK